MGRNYDMIKFISRYFISRRPGVANFAGIIKITIIFSKTTYKESIKVKKIRNHVLNCNFYLLLPI